MSKEQIAKELCRKDMDCYDRECGSCQGFLEPVGWTPAIEIAEWHLAELEKYTQFLVDNGYCDTDIYSETPTAIDRFLSEVK
jgi:hypothetical protein